MRVPTTKTFIQVTAFGVASFITFGILNISSAEAPEPSTTTVAPTSTTPPTTSTPTTTTVAPTTTVGETIAPQSILLANYTMGEQSLAVVALQNLLGIVADGHYGKQTRAAHLNALISQGLPTSNIPPEPKSMPKPEAKPSLPVVSPATTNSPTTSAPATTTTVAVSSMPASTKCPEYEATALSAGWAPNQLSKLMRIAYRESRCGPSAWNRRDPGTGSRGLTQINSFWCTPNKYNPTGFLQARGVLSTCEDLFNPYVSLRATYVIWQYAGWQPWGG